MGFNDLYCITLFFLVFEVCISNVIQESTKLILTTIDRQVPPCVDWDGPLFSFAKLQFRRNILSRMNFDNIF